MDSTEKPTNPHRPLQRPPITRADIPTLAGAVQGYAAWRAARGLEPSAWWRDKVRADLLASGLVKPKQATQAPCAPPGNLLP